MGRTIGAVCTLIVGMQVLIGVPALVCLAFFFLTDSQMGPVAVEVHSGHGEALPLPPAGSPAIGLPANVIPAAIDNPILASRAEHGSPLAGTVLSETVGPAAEQQQFVAALEKVAAESAQCPRPSVATEPASSTKAEAAICESRREKAAEFAVRHLYEMADVDEQAGEYERADQWRALAREIRDASASDDSAKPSAVDRLSELPATDDLPR